MATTKSYLPSLTGIRAIAAYMVFLHHFNPFTNTAGTVSSKLYSFCSELNIGVTIFFVLSGFLISLRYQGSVQFSTHWLFRYARNRFARIFPMYALITAIAFLAMAASPEYDAMGQYTGFSPANKIAAIALNLTLLKGFFANLKFTGVAQSWSLTVEECFYFTAPFVLASRSHTLRNILLYVVASYSVGLLLTAIGSHINFFGFFSNLSFLFSWTFFGRCIEFASGMALAQLVRNNSYFAFKHFTLAGVAGILLIVIAMTYAKGPAEAGELMPADIILNNVLLPVAICSLFLGLICEHSFFRILLESKLFDLLGKASYTFYLIHMGVIQHFTAKYISGNYIMLFVMLNVLAILLFKLIEEPMHKILRKLGEPAALTTTAVAT